LCCLGFSAFSQSRHVMRVQLPEQIKSILIPTKSGYDAYFQLYYAGNMAMYDFLEQGDKVEMRWQVYDEKDQKEPIYLDSSYLTTQNFEYNQRCALFKLKLPPTASEELIISVKFTQKVRRHTLIFLKRIRVRQHVSGFWLSKSYGAFPYLHSYTHLKDSLLLNSIHGNNRRITISKYQSDTVALPPMSMDNVELKRKVIFNEEVLSGNFWKPREPGFYVIKDSLFVNTIYVHHNQIFPMVTKAAQCIPPLIYISTNDERTALNDANEPYKKRLDNFLLSVFEHKEVAQKFMKAYFNRIETVNELFTSSTEGWKTDKGMLYLIFGTPDRVYLETDAHDWSYEKNPLYNELNFYIKQYPDTWGGTYDKMERLADYQKIWYGLIDKWRKGLIK